MMIDPWRPVPLPAVAMSAPQDRSPEQNAAVIEYLLKTYAERYAPRNGQTFCNIFLWDWSRLMGVEIPHWVDARTGEPAPKLAPPYSELTANGIHGWLVVHGSRFGWLEVPESTARVYAMAGKPAIAVWRNPQGIGHVGVLRKAPVGQTRIAQAGARNFADGSLADGFGARKVTFWVRD